jgi:hypothetical protein
VNAKVIVVCDNPDHPKGRVSTVAAYRRFPEGWEREPLMRPPAKRTRRNAEERKHRRLAEAAATGDPNAIFDALAVGGDAANCEYCGAGLDGLSRLNLEKRLETAAAQGMSRITLCQLLALSW